LGETYFWRASRKMVANEINKFQGERNAPSKKGLVKNSWPACTKRSRLGVKAAGSEDRDRGGGSGRTDESFTLPERKLNLCVPPRTL